MKKALIIIGSVVLAIVILAAAAFGIYWHSNIHWYDKYESALKEVGAVEEQASLPNGRVINYGEVENDKPALLLIHGQMGIWQDYALCHAGAEQKLAHLRSRCIRSRQIIARRESLLP